MNEKEFKAQLREAGAPEEAIAKIDFTKIEGIVDEAESLEGLCKTMKEAFPDFDETEFKKAIAQNAKNNDEVEDISEEALEAVAGGSVGSWMKKNKEYVIGAALLGIAFGIGFGMYLKGKSDALAKGRQEGIERGKYLAEGEAKMAAKYKEQYIE